MPWTSLCDLDELKEGEGKYVEIDGAKIHLDQGIWRDQSLLAEILLELVCINDRFQPARVPAALKSAIEMHLVQVSR